MLPVMAHSLLESISLLGKVSGLLAGRCVDGIVADAERCLRLAESSPSIVTPLNRTIGYEAAAKIAKHAVAQNLTIAEAVADLGYLERGELTAEQLAAALDVRKMTGH